MRRSGLHHVMYFIYKQFKVIWIVVTLIALMSALYVNQAISYSRSYQELLNNAKDLSKQIDSFIEDLRQKIYDLPLYGKDIYQCTRALDRDLERIVINNPKISGLIIADNEHHAICSTIEPNTLDVSLKGPSDTLLGPFTSTRFDQSFYIIRQKMGPYYIDVILVASVLKTELEIPNSLASAVTLYNKLVKKELISIEHNDDLGDWRISPNPPQTDSNLAQLVAVELPSLGNIVLQIFENSNTVRYHLWLSQIPIFFSILVLSFLLYNFISRNINNHYSLNGAIKLALRNEQFFPVYQPTYDRQNNSFCGVEVLLRWEHYDNDIIMPDAFIEEAESSDLIVPITLQILTTAFKEFKSILKKNPSFHLAINLSVRHFKNPLFFDSFEELRKHFKFQTKQILFEITERNLLDINNPLFINKMNELRALGYSLAIDDYGTGHASIAYLQRFPFNYLKIDKLFIQAIGTKTITESLNNAIIHMAKGLKLLIIAEGVETKEQVDYLTQNEVRYLQGWYYSKAVSINQIMELIQETHNEL